MRKLYDRYDNKTNLNVFKFLSNLLLIGLVLGTLASVFYCYNAPTANNVNGSIVYTNF